MTPMPQLVALFNGVGGGAAAIVAALEIPKTDGGFPLVASLFTVIVGSISFSGSVVTFLKLQEVMTTRPVVWPAHAVLFIGSLVGAVGLSVWVFTESGADSASTYGVLAVAGFSLLAGVLFVLPVGGADVPIVISLLNAFTGLTVAASGYVLGNVLLLVAGTLVGASGTILTRLMAQAMGRPVTSTLFGALRGGSSAGVGRRRRGPSGAVDQSRRRGDPARLRPEGHHRPGLRPRGRAGAAHGARARRPVAGARVSRCSTASTRWLAGCPGT